MVNPLFLTNLYIYEILKVDQAITIREGCFGNKSHGIDFISRRFTTVLGVLLYYCIPWHQIKTIYGYCAVTYLHVWRSRTRLIANGVLDYLRNCLRTVSALLAASQLLFTSAQQWVHGEDGQRFYPVHFIAILYLELRSDPNVNGVAPPMTQQVSTIEYQTETFQHETSKQTDRTRRNKRLLTYNVYRTLALFSCSCSQLCLSLVSAFSIMFMSNFPQT